MKNIYKHLVDALQKDTPLVLATIIETRGSSPQAAGASAILSSEGILAGTLGGGLLEADAQIKSLQALKTKKNLLYEFRLNADTFSEDRAICGGEVKILIDAKPEQHKSILDNLIRSLNRRQPGVLATIINRFAKKKLSLFRVWLEQKKAFVSRSDNSLCPYLMEIKRALHEGQPKLLHIKENESLEQPSDRSLFLEPLFPLPQLVIAGAGHIGQAVSHLGSLLNFEVTVIDDRPEFANKKKLPDADFIIVEDIGKAIQHFPIIQDTYIVIVTRGHSHDAEALKQCISSDAAYIGMIGSHRKIELTQKRFLQEGWATPEQLERVCAPIGIEIHSKTVEEIAVSIAAQLVLVRGQIQNRVKEEK